MRQKNWLYHSAPSAPTAPAPREVFLATDSHSQTNKISFLNL